MMYKIDIFETCYEFKDVSITGNVTHFQFTKTMFQSLFLPLITIFITVNVIGIDMYFKNIIVIDINLF